MATMKSMKIMISYFNNIRNFTPDMIPLSTAMWDPKWYREAGKCFVDKRGVINGLRANEFVLSPYIWRELIRTSDECGHVCKYSATTQGNVPATWCPFMKLYYQQLQSLNFKKMMKKFEEVIKDVDKLLHFEDINNVKIVLIVHEKPERLCSERYALKRWFADNNYYLEEVIR